MIHHKRLLTFLLLGTATLAFLGAGVARADAGQLDAQTKARLERFDSGPSFINVSKYPEGAQRDYRVFSQKCSQCHKLARPINSDYATPAEWSRYIKRMMFKPGSNISGSDAKKIYEFLVYDASVRKKALLDAKLAKMPASEKADQESKIAQIHKQFDNQ